MGVWVKFLHILLKSWLLPLIFKYSYIVWDLEVLTRGDNSNGRAGLDRAKLPYKGKILTSRSGHIG